MQANDGLARAGGTAHPGGTQIAASRCAPLVGMQKDHPVLDRSADHVGQELRLDSGERGAGPLVVQQPFEFEILGSNHGWSGRRWSLRAGAASVTPFTWITPGASGAGGCSLLRDDSSAVIRLNALSRD